MGQAIRCNDVMTGPPAETRTDSEDEIIGKTAEHVQQRHGYRIVSVNVGRPRETKYRGRVIRTGIFKEPVSGPVRVGHLNLEGDGQADLRVHGGADKAVYIYPAGHYSLWRDELRRELAYGHFGENLTVDGVLERDAHIGDIFLAGTALLQVTQPRFPCYKLGIRMGDQRFIRRFLFSGRTGFYARVLREGEVAPGDTLQLASSDPTEPTIADVVESVVIDR